MLDGLTPDLAPRLVLAIGGVGVALVILVLVLLFLKRRNSPLFIKGGKSREPRLMVLDAAAVDPKRRLVLIRRDDVEHLIMIGGPSDIVIDTGITDRATVAVPAERTVAPDEAAAIRAATAPMAEARAVPAVAERPREPVRPAPAVATEPARPVIAAQPEKPAVAPAELRATLAAAAAAQAIARPAPAQTNVADRSTAAAERMVPASERQAERLPVERAPVERQTEDKGVSAIGAMLYGEEREPAPDIKPVVPAPSGVQPFRPNVTTPAAAERPAGPGASAAEAALDAVRQRVLPAQPAVVSQTSAASESERALAARLEAARGRVQTAQPAQQTSQTAALPLPATDPVVPAQQPVAETPKVKDAEPSDFEKLLEAELDANGVFGNQPPQIRSESRVTNVEPAGGLVPPVRVTPPITGATPDLNSEAEVARLLGEIAVNRKP